MKKIKDYIEVFIVERRYEYLNNLIEILYNLSKAKKNRLKKFFYNIIVFVMEKLNYYGKVCISSNTKFCKYHSLIYFEQSKSYHDKYLEAIKQAVLGEQKLKYLKEQKEIYLEYINDINSGAIVLLDETFKKGKIFLEEIIDTGSGFISDIKKFSIKNIQDNEERCKIILSNYYTLLSFIQINNKITIKEAICIANIIKLNEIVGYFAKKNRTLLILAERCEYIIEHEKVNKNEQWCKEFKMHYETLKEISKEEEPDDVYDIINRIRKRYKNKFDEINNKFNTYNGKDFIKYIISKYPYKNYEETNNGINFEKYDVELIAFLLAKYHPNNYKIDSSDEQSQFQYCIAREIYEKLNVLYQNVRNI